jgi:hypothetical protein
MINASLSKDTTSNALKKSTEGAADFKYALVESSIVAITDQKGIINYAKKRLAKVYWIGWPFFKNSYEK